MIEILSDRKILYGGLILICTLFVAFGIKRLFSVRAQGAIPEGSIGAVVNLSTRNNKTNFSASDDVILQVEITNPNDHAIKILKWLIPLEGVQEPMFTVFRDGTPVAYLGPIFKRAAPTEKDYLTLAAGESLSTEVNLTALYDFSISGNYQISFDVSSIHLYQEIGEEVNRLTSRAVKLHIEGHNPMKP